MKRKYIIALSILVFASVCFAASILNYKEQGGARTVIGGSLDVVDGGEIDIESGGAFKIAGTEMTATAAELNLISGDTEGFGSLWFEPGIVPSANEGRVYYDSGLSGLKIYNGSTWLNIDMAGGISLDGAYDLGSAITVDGDAITLTADASTNNGVLTLEQDNTGAWQCLKITNAGTDPSIEITGTSTGDDITGTGGYWTVSETGIGSFAGLIVGATDIVLTNGEKILNDTNHEIEFKDPEGNYEAISFKFGDDDDIITLVSGTSADTLAMGDVDDLTGVGTIVFDAETLSSITITGNATDEDLLIQQYGTRNDVSLILYSKGIGTDSIKMYSDKGIDIDSIDDMAISNTATAGEDDFVIEQLGNQDASLILKSAGNGADALSLLTSNSAGSIKILSTHEIDIDAVDDITMTLTSGTNGEDFVIEVAGAEDSSLLLRSIGTGSDAISLQVTGDDGSIDIDAGDSVTIDANTIEITAADAEGTSSILLETNGDATDTLQLYANQSTIATSVHLLSDVGGITATATIGPILLNALGTTAGDLTITVEDDYTLPVEGIWNVDVNGTIDINSLTTVTLSSWSTGTAAIRLQARGVEGDIDIDASDTIAIDANIITLTASGSEGASDFTLETNADAADVLKIYANQGDTATSIQLLSDDGGITIDTGSDDAITLVPGSAGVTFSGGKMVNFIRDVNDGIVYDYTITVAESGGILSVYGPSTAATVTLTLPDASPGLQYTIIDANEKANADVVIQAAASDIINGGTASKAFHSGGADSYCSVILVAMNTTNWEIIAIFDPNDCWANIDSL